MKMEFEKNYPIVNRKVYAEERPESPKLTLSLESFFF